MAESIVQTVAANSDNWKVIKFACTSAANGSFAAVVTTSGIMSVIRDWSLYKYQVVIGATGPTAATDFTVKDAFGVDLLGGQGTDGIPASGTNEDYPKIADQAANQPIVSALTLAITNNIVDSAVFDIYLYFKRP